MISDPLRSIATLKETTVKTFILALMLALTATSGVVVVAQPAVAGGGIGR